MYVGCLVRSAESLSVRFTALAWLLMAYFFPALASCFRAAEVPGDRDHPLNLLFLQHRDTISSGKKSFRPLVEALARGHCCDDLDALDIVPSDDLQETLGLWLSQ